MKFSFHQSKILPALLTVLLSIAFGGNTFAQTDVSEITGTVADAQAP